MFKQNDAKVATALIIGGYLRAAEIETGKDDPDVLVAVVRSIFEECADWCEALPTEMAEQAFSPAFRQDLTDRIKANG